MNILLINHYAGSLHRGMEYRPYYFARQWVRMGHNVTIAAASYSHVRTTNPSCGGLHATEFVDGIRYLWFRTPSYSGNGLRRVFNIGVFVLQLFAHRGLLAKASDEGIVIASSTYPLDTVAAHAIAQRARARLVYEVHDLWPLSPIELGGMSARHPFIRVMQWAEDYAYRKVDSVISMLPLAEPHMRGRGLLPGKFHYVPNGIDPAEWRQMPTALPEEHRRVLDDLRLKARFLIGYAGAHGLANALDNVVRSAQLLADTPIVFVLIGQGPEKKNLEDLARRLKVANVVFLPAIPKASMAAFLCAMDVLVISLQRSSLFRFGVSPNKLMDYMVSGRPVIQAIDAGNDMVAESGCGFSVPAEDARALAEAALRMMNLTPADRDAMGRAGSQYVNAHHDYRLLAAHCLEAIMDESSRRI